MDAVPNGTEFPCRAIFLPTSNPYRDLFAIATEGPFEWLHLGEDAEHFAVVAGVCFPHSEHNDGRKSLKYSVFSSVFSTFV